MTIHDPDIAEPVETAVPAMFRDCPSSVEFNKLRKRLLRNTRQAIEDFSMARAGERWLVALSGGKDSYGLLAMLVDLKWRGLLPVELLACNLDQGQPNFPKHILPEFLTRNGVPHRIEYQDTYSVVTDKIAGGQHLLLAVLASQARPSLPHRARGGLLDAGARASPRGHPRDLLHEPVPWRAARRHAAEDCSTTRAT